MYNRRSGDGTLLTLGAAVTTDDASTIKGFVF